MEYTGNKNYECCEGYEGNVIGRTRNTERSWKAIAKRTFVYGTGDFDKFCEALPASKGKDIFRSSVISTGKFIETVWLPNAGAFVWVGGLPRAGLSFIEIVRHLAFIEELGGGEVPDLLHLAKFNGRKWQTVTYRTSTLEY